MISRHVKHFVFKTPEGSPLNYLPGQFITLYFDHQDKKLHRSYSLANPPQSNSRLEFAAGFVKDGPGSTLLFQLKPGDTLQANGPFGRLILKNPPPKRYVLVATSTGITPYRAMLPALNQALNENPDLEIVLLQGVQTRLDLLYHDEFIAFEKQHHPRVTYRAQLSREDQPNTDQYEHAGHVQQAFPALNLNPNQDLIYLCGNPSMVDESFTYMKTLEFPLQHIVREKYISR